MSSRGPTKTPEQKDAETEEEQSRKCGGKYCDGRGMLPIIPQRILGPSCEVVVKVEMIAPTWQKPDAISKAFAHQVQGHSYTVKASELFAFRCPTCLYAKECGD